MVDTEDVSVQRLLKSRDALFPGDLKMPVIGAAPGNTPGSLGITEGGAGTRVLVRKTDGTILVLAGTDTDPPLSEVLDVGNTTGGTNIAVTGTDSIVYSGNVNIGLNGVPNVLTGVNTTAIGEGITHSHNSGVAIGAGTVSATGSNHVIIGKNATAGPSAVAISNNSEAPDFGSIAIGFSADATGTGTNKIALRGNATANQAITVGVSSVASATNSSAYGFFARALHANSVALGRSALTTADNTLYTSSLIAGNVAAASQDCDMDASGRIYRVSSSNRYKQNIQDLTNTERVLQVVPKIYDYLPGHCGCGSYPENNEVQKVDPEGNTYSETEFTGNTIYTRADGTIAQGPCDGTCHSEVGYIAEDLEPIIPEVCSYSVDENGVKRVEGIQYQRLLMFLIPELVKSNARIATLETDLAALQATVAGYHP